MEIRRMAELYALYPEPQKGIRYESPELLLIRYIAENTTVCANTCIISDFYTICDAHMATQQNAVANLDTTCDANARRQKAFRTDNHTMCNLA